MVAAQRGFVDDGRRFKFLQVFWNTILLASIRSNRPRGHETETLRRFRIASDKKSWQALEEARKYSFVKKKKEYS